MATGIDPAKKETPCPSPLAALVARLVEQQRSRPTPVPQASALAEAAATRALEARCGPALRASGAVGRVEASLAGGVSHVQAVELSLPQARGIVFEETMATRFNVRSGLANSTALLERNPVSNHPTDDLLASRAGVLVFGVQAKVGQDGYVLREATSGKYPGPVLTTPEVHARLASRLPPAMVTDRVELDGVRAASPLDADLTEATRAALERELGSLPELSSWERFTRGVGEAAPIALGSAVVGAVLEIVRAWLKGEKPVLGKVAVEGAKSGVRALVAHGVGRWLLGMLQKRVLAAGATQAGIKAVARAATPVAAAACLLMDLVLLVWAVIRGEVAPRDLPRLASERLGGAIGSAIGIALGFFVGTLWWGPLAGAAVAILLGLGLSAAGEALVSATGEWIANGSHPVPASVPTVA